MTNRSVIVEVLLKAGFERFQCQADSRHRAEDAREVIAAAIGVPHLVLIIARDLPGHLIPAGGLLRADRCPRAEFTRQHGRAGKAQLGTRRPTDWIQRIGVPNLNQLGRSQRLDRLLYNDTPTTEIYALPLHDALPI